MSQEQRHAKIEFVVPNKVEPIFANAFQIGLLESGEACIDFGTINFDQKEVEVSNRIVLSQRTISGLAEILNKLTGGLHEKEVKKGEK